MQDWLVFVGVCAAVSMSPGPAILYIVTRTLEQGSAAGLASSSGIAVGGVIHVLASAFGVAAAAATWPVSLTLLQLIGAGYLGWLGFQRIRAAGGPVQVAIETDSRRLLNIFRDGVIVNLTNPKTALFLLAFLPQFVAPDGSSLSHQLLMLGMTFVAVAMLTDIGYVIAAGTVRARLAQSDRKRRWPAWLAGGLYLALGAAGLVDAVQRLVSG